MTQFFLRFRERATRFWSRAIRHACRNRAGGVLPTGQASLFVDVSVIVRHDAQTGIQRLVRAHLARLTESPPDGFVVLPVVATRRRFYRLSHWPASTELAERPVRMRRGDRFLGLDLAAHILPRHLWRMAWLRHRGVRLGFVIYDLLPLQRPDWFSRKLGRAFVRWFGAVTILADEVQCISRAVMQDFAGEYDRRCGGRDVPHIALLPVDPADWFVPANIAATAGPPDHLRNRPYLLTVGTIEPRKGYDGLLAAFEGLWASGADIGWVAVGKPGWKTQALQDRLRTHAEAGRRLFWMTDVEDVALQGLYIGSAGVILPSHAEGLGLPFMEAQIYGRPILARDLPVYQEIMREGADIAFFPRMASTEELTGAIRRFLESRKVVL